jgi:sugar O-acyltransferase (sialic acid O-acetyltransferase NeuD family)
MDLTSGISKIVFLGASTAFYEISEIIRLINFNKPTYVIETILDDNHELHGNFMRGIKVSGPLSDVHKYPECKFVFGIGSMKTRLIRHEIFKKLNIAVDRFPSIIHPQAVIDQSAKIGYGCIIHPGVCIGNDAKIDNFVVIAVNSAIGPYAEVNDYGMITSLAVVLSSAKIGKSSFIGSCSCITEGVVIGAGSMVGAGTVVSRSIDCGVFALGNPMRQISKIEINQELK